MEEIYDLAILGAGPAGICAAIYATRGKLNTCLLYTSRGKKLSRMNFLNLYLKGDRTFYGKGFYTF